MKKFFLIVFLAAAVLSLGFSQDAKTLQLSLKDAQQYAWDHNLSIENGDLSIQKAKRARWQTFASMLPQVSGSLDYQNYCGYEMVMEMDTGVPGVEPISVAIPLNPVGTMAVTAAVAVSGAQIVGTLLQDVAIEMADISAKKNRQQIASNVTQLYTTTLAMEETIGLLEQSLENVKTLYETTQNSVTVGVAEQTDADQLFIQVSSLQNTINSTKRSLEMLYNSLILQIGAEVDTKLILTDQLDNIIDVESTSKLVYSNFNLNNNYDYQLLKKNLDLTNQQVTLTVMDYVPSLSVFYQYSAKSYFGQSSGMNMTPPNLVGLSLNVPIFSSGVRTTKVQEAKLSHQIAFNEFKTTSDALMIQERQLKYNLLSAHENYETQNKNIEVSERVFNNISNKYEYGRASSLDVTNASTNLITAQSNYIQSIIDLTTAKIELKNLLNIND
ncbi:TolC family protein [Odoribacter sp. OttesenSCG-928-L07]|nr:TolC family protein [Odoribacter sp. OttesenSCG-928-L07]MDL2239469.1 TolC family protein [Bacteroidales bacterium OttesenSCG-928-L14]MDL2240688.1 TolC family protein [Bacteroidales bacterium OttesenSCG-928-K22]